MRTSKEFNEKFIQWLWENKKIGSNLKTISGKPVEIIFQGVPNFEDGPDFKNAVIKIDKTLKGDIEIHLVSRDWFSHKHNTDPKYNNVILHIVLDTENPVPAVTSKEHIIETLVLSRYLQKPLQELYEEFTVSNTKIEVCPCRDTPWHVPTNMNEIIFNQGVARFNVKKQKFVKLIKMYGDEQAVYIGVMESLGYLKNKAPFIKLANYVPINTLKRLTEGKEKKERIEIIQATLLGVAGFISEELKGLWEQIHKEEKIPVMQREEWQFFKVRPRGFPQYRIRNISPFLADAVKYGICNLLLEQGTDIKVGNLGEAYTNTVVLNVFLPVLSILSPEKDKIIELYESYKSLTPNSITDFMSKLLLDGYRYKKEIYNQGMLHIFHQYCKDKKCNNCPVQTTK